MYKFLYDIPHTRFAINALCFSEDGCILATGDDNGYVRLFDFPLGKESCTLKVATAVTSLQWHPNKSNVIFIGGARGIVTVMNLHTKARGFSLRTGVNAPVDTLVYDACNECLAVGVGTDIVLFSHPEDPWTFGSNIPPPPSARMDNNRLLLPLPRALKFSDDGCSLIVVYFQHGIVSWQIESLQPEWTIWPKSTRIWSISGAACFSADGKTVVVSNLFDGFDCYSIGNGEHLANLPTPIMHNVPLPSLFIEGGKSILCGSSCGYALLYSGNMNTVLQVLRHGEHDIIQTLVCLADPSEKAYCENEAKFIATASSEADLENYVRIWKTSANYIRVNG
ncbi:WD40 repeat-like protein [Suillus brevipes Sb2]|nr:WD40 repeat-like protein [Suillus brevipes Sb2]